MRYTLRGGANSNPTVGGMTRFLLRGTIAFIALISVCLGAMAGTAVSDSDSLIFVTGRGAGEILAIDTRSDAVVARYAVPGRPGISLAATDLGRLVSVSAETGDLHVFNIDDGKTLGSVDPGFDISDMRLSIDGRTLAVAGPDRVAFVDLSRLEVIGGVPHEGMPGTLVFDKAGKLLLVANAERSRVDIVDWRRNAIVDSLDVSGSSDGGAGIVHLARTPGGSTAMVVDRAGVATLIDLKKRRVANRITLPGRHERIFPTVNSQYFLLPNLGDNSISIISTWTYAESERLKMRGEPTMVNTVLADTMLFAFDPSSARIEVFDLDRRKRHVDIALAGKPRATIVGSGGLRIYVALQGQDAIAVIDVAALRVVTQIRDLGFSPDTIFNGGKLSYCH